MNILFLIGRIIFGGYFLMAGVNHFIHLSNMSAYAKSKGTPAPSVAVGGTGVLVILGGLSMLLGYQPVVGIALLVIFLLGVSFQMHAYWKVTDPQQRMGEQINFMKNWALIGALLMCLMIARPWPFGF